jgi:nitrogen fixation-related uncharacterized protein
MLINPDTYVCLQIAMVSLFAIFVITIFWGTRKKYFKDYGDIKRSNKKKKG